MVLLVNMEPIFHATCHVASFWANVIVISTWANVIFYSLSLALNHWALPSAVLVSRRTFEKIEQNYLYIIECEEQHLFFLSF